MTQHVRAKIDLEGNVTYVPMTAEEIAALEAAANPVPSEVTPYQARMALLNAALLETVETLMADPNTPTAAKIAWEYATVIQRHSPFISTLGPALGLTEAQIDDLFRFAATVE